MSSDKPPPTDTFEELAHLRTLMIRNVKLEHGFWMNASMAGKLFDLCHGSKELPDDEGKMCPCVGCRGCKPELAEDLKIGDYVPPPPVSGVRLKNRG